MRAASNFPFARILMRIATIVLVAVACICGTAASDPAGRFDRLGHQMMCSCGCNQILLECNHVSCPSSPGMRDDLQAGVDRGDSDKVVLAAFVQKYGPTVLAAPTMEGFDRVAWIMPFLVLALGIGGAVLLVRRWRHRTAAAPADLGSLAPANAAFEQRRAMIRRETEL